MPAPKKVASVPGVAVGCCAIAPTAAPIAEAARAAAYERHRWLWASGETVRYRFLTHIDAWRAKSEAERDVVRAAFKAWSDLGIGITFAETKLSADRPQIHIAFDAADYKQTWSLVGTEAGVISQTEKTMNFARTLLDAKGRKLALHEVGHAIGFKHEHLNPTKGIVWKSEEDVRAHFAAELGWPDWLTNQEVINKLAVNDFEGWTWDPDSIMNYDLPAKLISNRTKDVAPTGLSNGDLDRARRFYPRVDPHAVKAMKPLLTQILDQKSGEQGFFEFKPEESRKYTIATMGELDVNMSLFEQGDDGVERFMASDEDGGAERNAEIETRLFAGRRYVLRLRVLHTATPGRAAIVLY